MSKESETVRRNLMGLVQCPKCKKDAKKGGLSREIMGRRHGPTGEPRLVCSDCNGKAIDKFKAAIRKLPKNTGKDRYDFSGR